jgi:hypothetical protein
MVGSNDCVTKINNNKKKINEININNSTDTSIQKHNIHSQLYTYITASHSQCATQCNAMQCNAMGRDGIGKYYFQYINHIIIYKTKT